jgi:PAS domain S-box-containing protein
MDTGSAHSSGSALLDALDHVNHGVVIYDHDLTVLRINPRAREILRVTPDMFQPGEPFEKLARLNASRGGYGGAGTVDERVARRMAKARRFEPFQEDQRIFYGRYVEVAGRPGSGGTYVITYTDITRRVEAEAAQLKARDELEQRVVQRTQELQASEDRFRDFAETAANWFWERDSELRLSYLSSHAREIDFAVSESLGKTVEESMGASYDPDHPSDDIVAMRARQPYIGVERRSALDPARWIAINGHPIFAADGAFLGYRGTSVDITERKQAEQALQDSEDRFRDFAETAASWFWEMDGELRFSYFSANVRDIGSNGDEALGRSLEEMLGDAYDPADPGEELLALRAHRPYSRVERGSILRPDVWLEVSGRPVFAADGAFLGYRGSTVNITDRKQAEKALRDSEARLRHAQKLQAIGQLTGGVAHDFNNMLAVIIGNAELLEDMYGRDVEPVTGILQAAKNAAEMTRRLLAFSRQQPLNPQPLDLGALADGMRGMLRRTLGETIVVHTIADENLWLAAADSGQVENVILNLAINARDAMPGGGHLSIACRNVTLDDSEALRQDGVAPGDYVRLSVTDTGTGMSADIREKAFEPFFTTKEAGRGSGLGLSMVYGFARQSGGHAAIFSREGQGTTVEIYLPRAARAAAATEERRVSSCRGSERILVIEDNADLRNLIVRTLDSLGYRSSAVADAAAAGAALDEGLVVDLVLSDVVLPGGVSGPEFAVQARARWPGMKFLLMSGYLASEDQRKRILGGNETVLNKPFRRRQLSEALRAVLD